MIGTTPTHTWTFPFDTSLVAEARMIYKQSGAEILRKETEHFTMEGQKLSVTLSQEETFLFDCRTPVKIQLRVRTTGGRVLKTTPISIRITECLDREVL